MIYRSSVSDCKDCSLKMMCCPNTSHRKIARRIFDKFRAFARTVYESEAYLESAKERKKVELLFAHMKRHRGFQRLRMRGIKSANDAFLLVANRQNLRRMAKLCGQPPPNHGIDASVIP
ncbi:MAG: hypothetical protein ACI9VI_001753 [Candidatus Azotimanducaceae bacterium]|jgi:hypothetical protein